MGRLCYWNFTKFTGSGVCHAPINVKFDSKSGVSTHNFILIDSPTSEYAKNRKFVVRAILLLKRLLSSNNQAKSTAGNLGSSKKYI